MADPRLSSKRTTNLNVVANDSDQLFISPYAMDLIPYAPKFKFLYIVDIRMKSGFESGSNNKFALLTKTASRPNPKFITEEIPQYGVYLPIVKRTKFDPITLTFVDDTENEMMNFFGVASRWMSPIVNMGSSAMVEQMQYNFNLNGATNQDGENSQPSITPHSYSVSSNPTPFIDVIRVYHVYDYGQRYNLFEYCNPVITELFLDELDMASSENASLKVVFDYTHFNMEIGKPMSNQISTLVGNTITRMRSDL